MAKKVSFNEIRDIHEDWALDERNGKPYSGRSIQDFIKKVLNSKGGDFYYDADSAKYIIFADEESRNLYLSDREKYEDLVIGMFDAPANYTAEINMATPVSNVVLKSSKNNYIDFSFDIVNKNGGSAGDSVIVKYSFNNGGNVKTVTQVYSAGTNVHFLIDEYLSEGTNNISIVLTGKNTLASVMQSINFTVVSLSISSDFNFTSPVEQGDSLSILYTLKGSYLKYLEWYIDGVLLESDIDSISEIEVTRTKYISIDELSVGKHNVQVRPHITVNGANFYGETLFFDFIVCPVGENWGVSTTYTLLGLTLAEPVSSNIVLQTKQYEPINYKIGLYDYRRRKLSIVISDNSTAVQTISMDALEIVSKEYVPLTVGNHVLTFSTGGNVSSFDVLAAENDINIREEDEDILLKLSAKGRNNNEVTPNVWTYGSISASFSGINWNEQSGWLNDTLVIPAGGYVEIPFAALGNSPVLKGRTIEIEYEVANVGDNEDTSVLSLINSQNTGIEITATTAKLQSSGGTQINTKFRDGDRIRLSFIINRTSGNNSRMMFIVNNGILERAANFARTDNFDVNDNIIIGSANCVVKLYNILIYDKALTIEQAFGNFAINTANFLEVINRNDILDINGRIDADKVNAKIPVLIITGNMQPIFDATDKNATTYVDVEYTNLQDPTKNFKATHLRMRPQGTSSLGYPRKNLRLYTSDEYGCTMYDSTGEIIPNGKYAFKDNAQPVDCWTLKADYAESSGSHNTGVARLWNTLMYNCQVENSFPLRTEAQKAALANSYDKDVRTAIDGFPIVVFHRTTKDDGLTCLGQYNFNNDKSTESVFGFVDIPGFDNTNVQCFEVLANEEPLALFTEVASFDADWSKAFESRYPDTKTPNLVPLKNLCEWIYSCKNNQNKWNTEKANHFDVPKLAAYYIYLMRLGAVDQPVKNSMLTTEDGEHWFYINYDNDTVLGIDNISTVLNRWDYVRATSKVGGGYIYAGHESVLWNCFENDTECMNMVKTLDDALYSAGLTYNNLIQMFDVEQCDKWCERIYNDNGNYKYIIPFVEKGSAVLYMLQGNRKSYRHWWLKNRMEMFDAMWGTAAYKNHVVRFIAEGAPSGSTFEIGASKNSFFGYGINNVVQESGVSISKNNTHEFTISQALAIGDPINIYNANNINIVDLSGVCSNLTTLYMQEAIDNLGNSTIKKLILGDGINTNIKFREIGGLPICKALEELDIRGFEAINNVDISSLFNLHIFKAEGSGITSFIPAADSEITYASLPDSIISILLEGNNITDIDYNPTKTLTSLTIHNVLGEWNAHHFVNEWLYLFTDEELADLSLSLRGINWTNMTAAQVIKMGKVGNCSLSGKVTLYSLTPQEYDDIVEVFGENVFSPNSQFIIDAPAGIFLAGPETLFGGEQGQFVATAFPVTENIPLYYLYDSSGNQINTSATDERGQYYYTGSGSSIIKLYVASGIITVGSGLSSDVTLKIKVRINNTSTWSDFVTLQCKKLVMPTVTISGVNRIREIGSYDFPFSLGTYNAELQRMEVTFNAPNNVATAGLSGNKAVVNVLNVQGENTYTLRISAVCKQGTVYAEKSIVITDSEVIMDSTSNPEVLAVCYAQSWCANADRMTATEALGVTNIGTAFKGNTQITHFEEFEYFRNVTTLQNYAFSGCSNLAIITLPDSLTNIKTRVFDGDIKLTSIRIPKNVTAISQEAFAVCYSLTSITVDNENVKYDSRDNCNAVVETATNTLIASCKNTTIPNSVTSIGSSAFSHCSGLTSIIIPNSVTSIAYQGFANTELTSIEIPDSVTSIGNNAFENSSKLTSITIGRNVTSIKSGAFINCANVKTLTVLCMNAPSVQTSTFGNASYDYIGRRATGTKTLYVPSGATGYDQGLWADPLQVADKCNFVLSATL